MQVISKGLRAMDTTAITMCMDNEIPIIAFSLNEESSIKRAITGEKSAPTSENNFRSDRILKFEKGAPHGAFLFLLMP